MADSCIYLDTYVLQQDMKVRLPKAILSNMGVEKGKTKFDIHLDSKDNTWYFVSIMEMKELLTMTNNLTAVSLFTGVGGINIGFENAGVKVVFANELMAASYNAKVVDL